MNRRNSVTGEWLLYGNNHFNNNAAQPHYYWPTSPMPGFPPVAPWNMPPPGVIVPIQPAPPVFLVPADTKKSKKKKGGQWETVYADDGRKHWKHTGTGKETSIDPFV